MKKKKIIEDVNKLSKSQLKKYAQNNAKFINQNLSRLEKADMTYSKAYRYTQTIIANKPYMKRTKEGSYRFKSTKLEIEKLSLNQLRGLVKKISDYKQTESGTVTGQKKGTAKITVKEIKKKGKGKARKLGTVKVTVTKKKTVTKTTPKVVTKTTPKVPNVVVKLFCNICG